MEKFKSKYEAILHAIHDFDEIGGSKYTDLVAWIESTCPFFETDMLKIDEDGEL